MSTDRRAQIEYQLEELRKEYASTTDQQTRDDIQKERSDLRLQLAQLDDNKEEQTNEPTV